MNSPDSLTGARAAQLVVLDIGSTVVKLARVDRLGEILSQEFTPRDFTVPIATQVGMLLTQCGAAIDGEDVLVCSSANGGLRVGIVSLTEHFSGAALRNQALLAGANPMFVHRLDEEAGTTPFVDMLIVGGGIDCDDASPMQARLGALRLEGYRFGSLVYAGNRFLAPGFVERFPEARVVPNPVALELTGRTPSVFEAVRRAYLDDLVYKEGVSELGGSLADGIRPTPEVVNRGFQRALIGRSSMPIAGACILLDIGGATTDLHYTVEMVREDSLAAPMPGASVGRYVFTDLGIAMSMESLLLQMRGHPRLYEVIEVILQRNVREFYQLLREGEFQPPPEVLAYGCLFLALDRFARGQGPGLPTGDLNKVSQFVLTGGAAQLLSETVVARLVNLLLAPGGASPSVMIDRSYRIWVDGITWNGGNVT